MTDPFIVKLSFKEITSLKYDISQDNVIGYIQNWLATNITKDYVIRIDKPNKQIFYAFINQNDALFFLRQHLND